jgi:hypothetical protein
LILHGLVDGLLEVACDLAGAIRDFAHLVGGAAGIALDTVRDLLDLLRSLVDEVFGPAARTGALCHGEYSLNSALAQERD